MEIFSSAWFGALASIVLIDLVLAGDNAVVIALAARSLPKELQQRAVIWGTLGAIIVRIIAAIFVVFLLRIPGLSAAGGALLFWIAYGLLRAQTSNEEQHDIKVTTFWAAMKTIIIADALMGLDNILAISGAAQGDLFLVALGLVISIPIVMGGSILILKLIKSNPWIVWAGGALLGFTGGTMIIQDKVVAGWIAEDILPLITWSVKLAPAAALFILGWWIYRSQIPPAAPPDPDSSPE